MECAIHLHHLLTLKGLVQPRSFPAHAQGIAAATEMGRSLESYFKPALLWCLKALWHLNKLLRPPPPPPPPSGPSVPFAALMQIVWQEGCHFEGETEMPIFLQPLKLCLYAPVLMALEITGHRNGALQKEKTFKGLFWTAAVYRNIVASIQMSQ